MAPEVTRGPEVMNRRWRVEKDDLIGGHCVVVDQAGTPAAGNPALMDFVHNDVASHVVDLHNDWLIGQPRSISEIKAAAVEEVAKRAELALGNKVSPNWIRALKDEMRVYGRLR